MNAFEDIVKFYLEEEGYWVRQSVKVHRFTKEDKKLLNNSSMPTPEIDIVAYKAKNNELILIEVKSYLDSYGVDCEEVMGINKDADRYKLFTHNALRQKIVQRLTEEYIDNGLINANTTVKFALAAGKIHNQAHENKIRKYFADASRQWILFSPSEIKKKISSLSEKSYEDNVITTAVKLVTRNN
jgi:hypothetical protein